MLTNCQIDRVLGKLKRFETTLEPMLFEPITSLDAQMYETEQNLDSAPVDAAYIPAKKVAVWGGEWKYCWFPFFHIQLAIQNLHIFCRKII